MPFPRSKLSDHAALRVSERFNISPSELLHILNANLGKRIGATHHTKLIHRLLWSPADDQLLVVIQDVIDGAVLTALTIEMYLSTYEHNVTERRVATAINQMVHAGMAPQRLWSPSAIDESVIVYAHLQRMTQPVSLGRWRGKLGSANLSVLGREPGFWRWAASRIQEKGYDIGSLARVTARFSGGEHQAVPHEC